MKILQRLGSLFSKRSIENPAIPLTAKSLISALGGGVATDSGVSVSESSALLFDAVFAAVRIRSESIGVLPIKVYEKLRDGTKREATAHPAYALLHDSPNPDMTPVTFKKTLQAHLDTHGKAFARIVRDGGGNARALYPLRPDQTIPRRTKSGALVYQTRLNSNSGPLPTGVSYGQQVVLGSQEVLHLPGLGFDGIDSYSPIGMARQMLGVGMAAERFRSKFFKNGAWLGGVLKHPEVLNDEALERLRNQFAEDHGGVANAFKPKLLEAGLEWQEVSIPKDDALMIQLGVFTVRGIARLYRIPLHMLADMQQGASFASISQTALEFTKFTLADPIKSWEEECTRKLMAGRFYAEFITDAFLRGDQKSRFEAYTSALQNGWMSINEVRQRENLDPIPGGDAHHRPLNQGPVASPPDGSQPSPPPPAPPAPASRSLLPEPSPVNEAGLVEAHKAIIAEAAGRFIRKEIDRAKRYAKKDPEEFRTWAEVFYTQEREHVFDVLHLPANALLKTRSAVRGEEVTAEAEAKLVESLSGFVDTMIAEARDELVAAHRDGPFPGLLDRWETDRQHQIAEQIVEIVNGL